MIGLAVGVFGLHLLLQGWAPGPWLPDEVAYLGGADALAGRVAAVHADLPYYRWGYSAVLAPVARLPLGPGAEMAAVGVVNAVLLAAVLPLVHRLLVRAFGATGREAVVGALVASLQPVVWAYGGFALAEPLLLALVPAWLLAVRAAVAEPRRTGPLVAATLALYATHERLVVVLALVALVLVARGRSPGRDRTRALAAGGALAVGVMAVHLVDVWMRAVRWDGVTRPQAADGGPAGLFVDPSRWDDLIAHAVGQGWQLVVSGGVPLVLGVVVAAGRSRPWFAADPEAAVARSALLLLGGLAVTSVVFSTLGGTRADHLVYGRYAEVALPPLLGVGVVALVRATRAVVPAAVATVGLTGAGWLALAHLPAAAPLRTDRVPVLHAPSLALLTGGDGPLAIGRATVVAVVLAGVVAIAARLWRDGRPGWRRVGAAVAVAWLLVVGTLDLARSAIVVRDGHTAHVRAEARR